MVRCNLVFPVWVRVGSVRWVGQAEAEKLYSTERVACGRPGAKPKSYRGLTVHLCPVHAVETFNAAPPTGSNDGGAP